MTSSTPLPPITSASTTTTNNDTSSPTRKVHHTSERLLQHPKRVELPPLQPGPKLSKLAQNGLADRLCTQSMIHKKNRLDHIRADAEKYRRDNTKVLAPEECEAAVQRLYYNSQNQMKETARKLDTKYADALRTKQNPNSKVLSTAELKQCAQRLCTDSQATKNQNKDKLVEKYITSVRPTFRKLTKEELEASASRLCQNK